MQTTPISIYPTQNHQVSTNYVDQTTVPNLYKIWNQNKLACLNQEIKRKAWQLWTQEISKHDKQLKDIVHTQPWHHTKDSKWQWLNNKMQNGFLDHFKEPNI